MIVLSSSLKLSPSAFVDLKVQLWLEAHRISSCIISCLVVRFGHSTTVYCRAITMDATVKGESNWPTAHSCFTLFINIGILKLNMCSSVAT